MPNKPQLPEGVMLNVYPDSIGGNLAGLADLLELPALENVFKAVYLLPSVFNTDLDRGFSVIDYHLNRVLAPEKDLERLKTLGLNFKFDFVLNHASVLSKPFQDLLEKGEASPYVDYFIDWNRFWSGNGKMTVSGYIQPDPEMIQDMFFRKPGLPILDVPFNNGEVRYYWNTFYQEVTYDPIDARDLMKLLDLQYLEAKVLADAIQVHIHGTGKAEGLNLDGFEGVDKRVLMTYLESRRRYLGQMDLNIQSPLVWGFYQDTLKRLAGYGAKVVRLDAFAYAPKAPGTKNFMNEPDTFDLLERVNQMASEYKLQLLPEIHARYDEKIHEIISEKGYLTYDFFLPGLLLHTLENQNHLVLKAWMQTILEKDIKTVHMLGCHDGIPLLDLKGLLSDAAIDQLIQLVVSRGGHIKDLHGQKNMYYQVNATYYSALGGIPEKLLMARAIQMMMPGQPQVWYLDLFAGENDYEALKSGGSDGHKAINRTNLTREQVQDGLNHPLVQKQLEIIRLRNTHPVFNKGAIYTWMPCEIDQVVIRVENHGQQLTFRGDLKTMSGQFEETGLEF